MRRKSTIKNIQNILRNFATVLADVKNIIAIFSGIFGVSTTIILFPLLDSLTTSLALRILLIYPFSFSFITIFYLFIFYIITMFSSSLLKNISRLKKSLKDSKIFFDYHAECPKNNKRQYYLIVKNKDWFIAKDVSLFWGEPSVSNDVPNIVIAHFKKWDEFTEWENKGYLKWKEDRNYKINIGRKVKYAYLLELDIEREEFCIQTFNRELFNFPIGNYRFPIHVHAKMTNRYSDFSIFVDVEYRGGDNLDIKEIRRN